MLDTFAGDAATLIGWPVAVEPLDFDGLPDNRLHRTSVAMLCSVGNRLSFAL